MTVDEIEKAIEYRRGLISDAEKALSDIKQRQRLTQDPDTLSIYGQRTKELNRDIRKYKGEIGDYKAPCL